MFCRVGRPPSSSPLRGGTRPLDIQNEARPPRASFHFWDWCEPGQLPLQSALDRTTGGGHHVSDAVERLVNLALFLADAQRAVSAAEIRADVVGLPARQDDAAFMRMFERDKDDLRRIGVRDRERRRGQLPPRPRAHLRRAVELDPAEAAVVRGGSGSLLDDASFPFAADLRLALAKITAEEPGRVGSHHRPALADEDPAARAARRCYLTEAATTQQARAFGYTNSRGRPAPHRSSPTACSSTTAAGISWVETSPSRRGAHLHGRADVGPRRSTPRAPKTPDFERPDDFDVARFIRLPFQYGPAPTEFEATLRLRACGRLARAQRSRRGHGRLETGADGTRHCGTCRPATRIALMRFVIEARPRARRRRPRRGGRAASRAARPRW